MRYNTEKFKQDEITKDKAEIIFHCSKVLKHLLQFVGAFIIIE